ncbi:MAG: DUF4384 domain-containing protein [Thiomargarita sp.]|nr:DUF4384 domain-containing protein [Thiomargarita sp.]
MKDISFAIIIGTVITVVGLFIEDRFFNDSEPPIIQVQTSRDIGGIADDEAEQQKADDEAKQQKFVKKQKVGVKDSPISVKIQYLYRHKQGKAFKTLTNDVVLHSGDYYKIVFTPTETTFLYIFQRGSSSNIFRLFPMKSFKGVTVNNQNPVQANAEYYIPAKGKSFYLDNKTGKESIYVIVARQRDKVLEAQYQQVLIARQEQNQEKIKIAQTNLNRAIKMRDMGGIAEDSTETELNWTESGQQFSTVLARLTSCDGCVSPLNFWHR